MRFGRLAWHSAEKCAATVAVHCPAVRRINELFELEEGKDEVGWNVGVRDHPVLGPFPRDESRMGNIAAGHRVYERLTEEVFM